MRNSMRAMLYLSECYVMTGRADEAMDLHKSQIGKESLDHDAILLFAEVLQVNHDNSHALTILEEHLEAIETSCENQEQCRAYGNIARLYRGKNDFTKSNVYCERQLSIAKEMKDVGRCVLVYSLPTYTSICYYRLRIKVSRGVTLLYFTFYPLGGLFNITVSHDRKW